eukprot:12772634-Ditylum_brightwellii.AAC.1
MFLMNKEKSNLDKGTLLLYKSLLIKRDSLYLEVEIQAMKTKRKNKEHDDNEVNYYPVVIDDVLEYV